MLVRESNELKATESGRKATELSTGMVIKAEKVQVRLPPCSEDDRTISLAVRTIAATTHSGHRTLLKVICMPMISYRPHCDLFVNSTPPPIYTRLRHP